MKRFVTITLVMLFVLGLLAGMAGANGRWAGKHEGNGVAVWQDGTEVDIGWNFRLSQYNEIYGNMNFVEKIAEGENNHYRINLQQEPIKAGDPTERPMLFNTNTDEVRIEGLGVWMKPAQENELVYLEIHLRGPNNTDFPNTIYYRVWSANKKINYVDTGRIPITY